MSADNVRLSPAEQASEATLTRIQECIREGKNFLLEAGAGAGKTYSLVETLNYLIKDRGNHFIRNHQQIACITYTNIAADEIRSRTRADPAIHSSTIHTFCWSLIKDFQPFLRGNLPKINEKWPEKIEEAGGVEKQKVLYDLGYRRINDKEIKLHHDDVLSLMVMLLSKAKFQNRLVNRYPVLFIDEYQDTASPLINCLKSYFLDVNTGPLIGFFGDHWQKIYGTGCGKIEHPNLVRIGKEANFRSASAIVNVLNQMRPGLPQKVNDPNSTGRVNVFHTNNWSGQRRTGAHWKDDLPPEIAHRYLEDLKIQLEKDGWEFAQDKSKILMLTNNVLAEEQGYRNLSDVFEYNDSFLKKEDPHIAFMVDILEPVCIAYANKQYGEMFSLLGRRTPLMISHEHKKEWARDMDILLELRNNGSIGDVIDHLRQTRRPCLPESVEDREHKLSTWLQEAESVRKENRVLSELRALRVVAYREVIALSNFLNDLTPFSTKHGVKGAEFENVLVVCGCGWNQYNFNQFLEWANICPPEKKDSLERNRNLFYVACSRPKKRLCILFTQLLSEDALDTLKKWFGEQNIEAISKLSENALAAAKS